VPGHGDLWLREFAPAKVNLFLHVTERRADGYHLLDSLAVFPAVGDWLRAMPAEGLSLMVDGPFGSALAGEADNLVLRAARALGGSAGAQIVLEKHLPVASGIGGGSADAAAALRLLCRLWRVGDAGPAIAVALGADVPVCLASRPARMGGVGETLTAAPWLPACGLVLVNPGVALETAEVFRARGGGFSAPARLPEAWADAAAMAGDLAVLRNDLEAPAMALRPVIGAVLAAISAVPGCLLARMSGSGATCFGLFSDAGTAEVAARALARPGWWCWGGGLTGR
jgi:4-diphosphocytidyl-2-C-methyl-D-erythritol kinase